MPEPLLLIAATNELLRSRLSALSPAARLKFEDPRRPHVVIQTAVRIRPDLIVLASTGADADGVLALARELKTCAPVVLIAEDSSEGLAVAALRAGVVDYLRWPFPPEELKAIEQRLAAATIAGPAPVIIGDAPCMLEMRAYIRRVASANCNVLITGETGTGKELAAGLIHAESARRAKPLVCINCAAIPDSLFESELFGYERGAFTGAHAAREGKLKLADRGTVFLDEIADMSPYAQAKILRVLETNEVERLGGSCAVPLDLRFIAATNRDVDRMAETDDFRKDLYFRLNVVRVHLPPLRERKADVPLLAAHYIECYNRRFGSRIEGISDGALELLMSYGWPGNVRELKNVIEAVFVSRSAGEIGTGDLPARFRHRPADADGADAGEPDRLLAALLSTNWNKSKAAEALQWSRMTLYRKMAKYNLKSAAKPERMRTVSAPREMVQNL